jgi:hypothetical protein
MKFNELQVGVEYAVIPSWQYSSREKKDPQQVRRHDVEKATLVNLTKYEYKVYRSDNANHPEFVKAPQGSRSVGYLVSAIDGNQNVYWLARPQDIVERWSILEPIWAEKERLEREEHERAKLERERAEEQRKLVLEQRARLEKATLDSLQSILGGRANASTLYFDTRSSRDNNGNYKEVNTVRLDLELAQILIEKVLEAKEVIG